MLRSTQHKKINIFITLVLLGFILWGFNYIANDKFESVYARDTNLRIVILPTPAPTRRSSGGGGGGGGGSKVVTSVIFTGKAYPLSKVGVLKDGQLAISVIAGPDGKFNVALTGMSSGNYVFSVYGEDNSDRRSSLFTFPVYITKGATTQISGIFIPPTISVDKSQVVKGDNIAIFGQSKPDGDITISVHSQQEFFVNTQADKNGVYLYNFDTSVLELGDHATKSKVAKDGEISSFGNVIGFSVGGVNVPVISDKSGSRGDLNNDRSVNLLDFSIMAFWYLRAEPPIEIDLKADGKIDLVDFSILAYYWTG